MSIKQIKSLVQFARGSKLVWEALTTPIPNGVVVFSIDDGTFKLGDGVTTYINLPALFTYNDLIMAEGGASNLFKLPTIDDQDEICVVSLNTTTGKMEYAPSGTTLTSLLASLTLLETTNSNQSLLIASTLAEALAIDISINTAVDDKLVVVNNARYTASAVSLSDVETLISDALPATVVTGSHIEDVKFYTTPDMDVEVDKHSLIASMTYYVNIIGFHDNSDTPGYYLSSDTPGIVIAAVGGIYPSSLFSLYLPDNVATLQSKPIVLIAGMNDGVGSIITNKPITIIANTKSIIAAIYGGTGDDYFSEVTTDSNNNIICCGRTTSEGLGLYEALVVKFDTNLNILAKKRYGGTGDDRFDDITTDSNNNIICCGHTYSEGLGSYEALVVKFDTNLNILAKKRYGGTGSETFYGINTDANNNIICCGWTTSEGAGSYDALVVKFDTNLNILARKTYGGVGGYDVFYNSAIDSNNNIICCGYTTSEGLGSYEALVVKFDTNLNILAKKRYGGTGDDYFNEVTTDSNNNIICCGRTTSEGLGSYEALVVKFDTNLNILAKKRYGGTGEDIFFGITTDSNNNIICCGYTASEGLGSYEALVVKFDTNLNILARKRYGGTGEDYFNGVTIDSNNNIICCGRTTSEGLGADEALVIKISSEIPSGTFTGTVLTGLTFADSNLTLADSNLTLADSALTLADSNLTLADSNLTLADSNLTSVVDIIG